MDADWEHRNDSRAQTDTADSAEHKMPTNFDFHDAAATISGQAVRSTHINYLLYKLAAEADFEDSWTGNGNHIAAVDNAYRVRQTVQRLRPQIEDFMSTDSAVSRLLMEQVQDLNKQLDLTKARPHRSTIFGLLLVIAGLIYIIIRTLQMQHRDDKSRALSSTPGQKCLSQVRREVEDDDYEKVIME
ncbi:MAG: hypothetical protein M1828_005532 [Chrysothrix sp. TS-e1954]|nr:MAG: hypothetical protein M1828_005532 [Chrysothrix sp. TS-e1954]